jgi:hypothetical protein
VIIIVVGDLRTETALEVSTVFDGPHLALATDHCDIARGGNPGWAKKTLKSHPVGK